MSLPDIWIPLETYADIIINGLDLLSFLFITPEVFRILEPALARFIPLMFGIYFAGFWLYYISNYFRTTVREGGIFQWILLIPMTLLMLGQLGLAINVAVHSKQLGFKLERWMTRYALLVGVMLFILSRMVAFLVAVHKVL
jgi:hypothetical protein